MLLRSFFKKLKHFLKIIKTYIATEISSTLSKYMARVIIALLSLLIFSLIS